MPKRRKRASLATASQESDPVLARAREREELIEGIQAVLCRACGVKSPEVAQALASQVAHLQVWTQADPDRPAEALGRATALLSELAPRAGVEALLAVQMVGVHEAATQFLRRATLEDQTAEGADRNVLRSVRLMRLFTEQTAALAKLKGRTSQQKVTVEHVHVHDGGQAVVGAVNSSRGEGSG
jgi:hypothetical protein